MFEPAHGSAPKYKGLEKVNPTAAILSGAMMVEYVGEPEIRDVIFKATNEIIIEGKKTSLNEFNKNLLASEYVIRNINQSHDYDILEIGEVNLKGKKNSIKVFSIE